MRESGEVLQPHHSAVILYYKYFVPSETCQLLQKYADYYVDKLLQHQVALCTRLGLKGRVLLSIEGINGSLSGENRSRLQDYMDTIDNFDLIRDCGLPEEEQQNDNKGDLGPNENRNPYAGIDWKESSVNDNRVQPFPDLKISLVNEIVSTGGTVTVDDIPKFGGRHLTPEEFHNALMAEQQEESGKEIVLIDVRNTYEYDIGHFIDPKSQKPAVNPSTVTFSTFDSNFCAKYAGDLKDKKVLMYCTGGIRCEKASAMLRKRGVEDVAQLKGGIHRYLEKYGNEGFFRGRNFVFDQRVTWPPVAQPKQEQDASNAATASVVNANIVGTCVACEAPFDQLCGSTICTVCRDLVLICPCCQSSLREYHCRRHASWKDCYFTFLEPFDQEELAIQKKHLQELHETMMSPSQSKNVRRTLKRQIAKIDQRMKQLASRQAAPDRNAPCRCRSCMEPRSVCNGRCWGFWKFQKTAVTPTTENVEKSYNT
jgi:predicted sulfurtransferase